jgi:hypothetical protein
MRLAAIVRGDFAGSTGGPFGLSDRVLKVGHGPRMKQMAEDARLGFTAVDRLPFGSLFVEQPGGVRAYGIMDITTTLYVSQVMPWLVADYRDQFKATHVPGTRRAVYVGTCPAWLSDRPRSEALAVLWESVGPFIDLATDIILDQWTNFTNESVQAEFAMGLERNLIARGQALWIEQLPRMAPEYSWSHRMPAFLTAGHLRYTLKIGGNGRRIPGSRDAAGTDTMVWYASTGDPHTKPETGGPHPPADDWLRATLTVPGVIPAMNPLDLPVQGVSKEQLLARYAVVKDTDPTDPTDPTPPAGTPSRPKTTLNAPTQPRRGNPNA